MTGTTQHRPAGAPRHAIVRAVERWGGMLVRPRATLRALGPEEGARDGLWLGGLYLFGTGTFELLRSFAALRATANLSGAVMLLSTVARVLLVPIVVLVLCETVLGRTRAHRRGVMLVPLLVVVAVAHELAVHGVPIRSLGPEIVGGLLSIVLAWRTREAIEPATDTDVPASAAAASKPDHAARGSDGSRTTSGLRGLVGALVIGLALLGVGRELHRGWVQWDHLGPLPPGGETPAFEVITLDGGRFDQHDLRGKVSVLTFWATWCPACRSELDDLDELQHEYAGRDVQFLAVNNDGGGLSPLQAAARVQSFVRERSMTLPTALDDGSAARSFRVGPIPHTLIVGADGVVRYVHQGRVMSSTLRGEIEALLEP